MYVVFLHFSPIHKAGALAHVRSEGYNLVYVCMSVCLSVCLSVSSNLPSRAITHPTRGTNGISAVSLQLLCYKVRASTV